MKKALITGITGQDGSYLAELLLSKGYEVHGIIRRSSAIAIPRIIHLYQDPHQVPDGRFRMYYGDMSDGSVINQLIKTIRPDEIYHLASQSHVRVSFDIPEYTGDITALGATRVLDAIRNCGYPIKFYQASSSEMFGQAMETPQKETTPLRPRSPYACAKAYAYWLTINYREAYGMFAVNGVLFNHESPRRGETFVSRKITRGIARIKAGLDKKLYLGNLKARRDWGYAPDYVEAMWLMLQQDTPDDYVIATGQSHSVEEFLTEAFTHAGLGDWRPYVEIDPRYFRPTEVDHLVGDASKAERMLGWKPTVNFQELVAIMVDADLEAHGVLEAQGVLRAPHKRHVAKALV